MFSHKHQKHYAIFLNILNILAAAFLFTTYSASAAIDCKPSATTFNHVATLPGITLNVGEDLPLGSVIYNFTTRAGVETGVTCHSDTLPQTFQVPINVDYLTTPLPLSGYAGSGLAGKVYETGHPGVGVVITGICRPVANCLIPRVDNALNFDMTLNTLTVRVGRGWNVWLIKTGPIAPGTINGSMLPSLKTFMAPSTIYSYDPGYLNTVSFNGSINFTAATCQTPDVNVNLGKYDVKDFDSIGKTTPWIASNIRLINCNAAFSGYYDLNNTSVSLTGSGVLPAGTRNNNALNVSLSPQSTIIDATNGVMAVTSSNDAPAAQGIGIQIGWGNATGAPQPYNFQNTYIRQPASDGRDSMNIPLAARYIRTGNDLKPGRADGKVTFTINYY
ncbi:type 1 fimbrial protein [Enterobacteriaceae bacterium 89]|nr:type 1 fimbrial protein [Enterobacteriaceae bacterium 89]